MGVDVKIFNEEHLDYLRQNSVFKPTDYEHEIIRKLLNNFFGLKNEPEGLFPLLPTEEEKEQMEKERRKKEKKKKD